MMEEEIDIENVPGILKIKNKIRVRSMWIYD